MDQFLAFTQANPLILLALLVWVLPWKGMALWRAAERKEEWWFIAMLILNTLGILEILYLFVFSKRAVRTSSDAPTL